VVGAYGAVRLDVIRDRGVHVPVWIHLANDDEVETELVPPPKRKLA